MRVGTNTVAVYRVCVRYSASGHTKACAVSTSSVTTRRAQRMR